MYVKWFEELSKKDIKIAGGKGANLGEMYNAGFPVPPGFVITSSAYKYFIEKTGIKEKIKEIIENIDINNAKELLEASKKIQELIVSKDIPEDLRKEIVQSYEELCKREGKEIYVAVRSSATAEDLPKASFAGQQATFLCVKGEKELIEAVKKCWASLWTARAISYREHMGFRHEDVLMAVVVQKQIFSEKSGVMFTANPVTNDESEIVIEGSWGLGEAIVSGSVTPDEYIIDKDTLEIKKIKVNEKRVMVVYDVENKKTKKVEVPKDKRNIQCLNENEIIELAKIGRKIEEHYGYPQDIEWAIENEKIYIVQTRNITTLKKEEEKEEVSKEGKIILKGIPASPGIGYGKVKIIMGPEDFNKFEEGEVLVTTMTNPDFEPLMAKASAIVTDEGGVTSHAAIVSRELGKPCIVGTKIATKVLKEEQTITVDGYRGLVYGGIVKEKEEKKESEVQVISQKIITATKIFAIADYPEVIKEIKDKVDGIGLLRLEFLILRERKHPRWYLENDRLEELKEILVKRLKKILELMYPKPVIVRTFDLRTDEYRNLLGGAKEPKEANPMMGWHGIRRDLDQPEILRTEFEAFKELIKTYGLKNLWIMIPFVISVDEVRRAKEILRSVGLEPSRDVKFGIMVETPAACMIIEDIIKKEEIDFISFGTNDLTQLTLGVDRNNEWVAKLFDEAHPAVLKLIENVIKICKKYGVYTSICGQAGSREDIAEFLVKLGIDSISVNRDAIDYIREVVARTERKILLEISRRIEGKAHC